jgi:hypothetical protein
MDLVLLLLALLPLLLPNRPCWNEAEGKHWRGVTR